MFKEIIFKNIPPSVNNFPSNRLKYSKDYSLIKEETSLFETLMLEKKNLFQNVIIQIVEIFFQFQ